MRLTTKFNSWFNGVTGAANKTKGDEMDGLDAAQDKYDRQEPDWDEDEEEALQRELAEDLAEACRD